MTLYVSNQHPSLVLEHLHIYGIGWLHAGKLQSYYELNSVYNAVVGFESVCNEVFDAAQLQAADFEHFLLSSHLNFSPQFAGVCDSGELYGLLCVRNSVLAYQMLVWQLVG